VLPARLQDDVAQLTKEAMPYYIQAMETPRFDDSPATVAMLWLRLAPPHLIEPLEKVVVCRWPLDAQLSWDWPYESWNDDDRPPDCCAVLYWAQSAMKSNTRRDCAFSYGLGGPAGWAPEADETQARSR
jgi:hypothetical protein